MSDSEAEEILLSSSAIKYYLLQNTIRERELVQQL